VSLIDFDLASPGSRLWDVACAARLWAPLRPDRYIDDARRGRATARLRLFVDSYRLSEADRIRFVSAVLQNHEWSYDIVGVAAAAGHAAFTDYWANGAMERAHATRQWYIDNAEALQEVVLRGTAQAG
jgi:hypothetical protein